MPPATAPANAPPRMFVWAFVTAALMLGALAWQQSTPGGLVAVTLYKAHLLALGGWGGYWLDRALFPYDRPHIYLDDEPEPDAGASDDGGDAGSAMLQVSGGNAFSLAMLRRAIVVAACLVCVGLGA